jgi:hypothetical protein
MIAMALTFFLAGVLVGGFIAKVRRYGARTRRTDPLPLPSPEAVLEARHLLPTPGFHTWSADDPTRGFLRLPVERTCALHPDCDEADAEASKGETAHYLPGLL